MKATKATARRIGAWGVVAALVVAPPACFEGGPLEPAGVTAADVGLVDDAGDVDAEATPDTTAPLDSAPADTGGDTQADGVGPDAAADISPLDTGDGHDDGDADTSHGPPCLTVSDCAAVAGPDDRCVGQVACVDYECVVAPVVCPDTGDPCLDNACDPATGECVVTDVCSCVPVGDLLCGQQVDYATSEAGATQVISGYGCPTAVGAGAGAERVYTFQVGSDQRARVDVVSAGVESLWVVAYDEGGCDPTRCLGGGATTAVFDAVAGERYAVVVEENGAGGVVSLSADCGITAEDRCHDGVDDDGDGVTDCADGDCAGAPGCAAVEVECADGIDNEGDGLTDCADGDCAGAPACAAVEVECADGIDNEGDGLTDCVDPDCKPYLPCTVTEQACGDGLDNDGDGLTDCGDGECATHPDCVGPPQQEAAACFDGIDNEPDGKTDCADEDCWGEPLCLQACHIAAPTATCGFTQGAPTGGGKARMTDYQCGPGTPMAGKEVVYPFSPSFSGFVTVSMSGAGLSLFVLQDQGLGCTPLHCIGYGPHQVTFYAVAGTDYYFAIDAPAGVTGNYIISVECGN